MHVHLLNMLATWRLTRLLMEERAPYAVLDRVREYVEDKRSQGKVGVEGVGLQDTKNIWYEVSEALQCPFCLSIWVGIALAIVTRQNVLWGFAYSAGSLLFGRLFERIEG